jgi:hypothetical protein
LIEERLAFTDHIGVDGVEKYSEAAAPYKLAVAENVVGKSNARGNAVEICRNQRIQDAMIADERESTRSAWKLRRLKSGTESF